MNKHHQLQGLDTSSHVGALRLMRGFQLVGGAQEEVDIACRLTRDRGTRGHACITGQCFLGGTLRKRLGCVNDGWP